jgi:hypothetical protein
MSDSGPISTETVPSPNGRFRFHPGEAVGRQRDMSPGRWAASYILDRLLPAQLVLSPGACAGTMPPTVPHGYGIGQLPKPLTTVSKCPIPFSKVAHDPKLWPNTKLTGPVK